MPDETEWHFGPFRLEVDNARLWRGPERLPLRPKSFAVLHYLLQHAGRLVPKDALLQAVWPDVAVSEAMLTICLSELRRVLGETRQTPQFIETVARRGYRFIGAVQRVAPAGAADLAGLRPPSSPVAPGLLVGREAALAQVQGWWGRAQQGERQVGLVTGEAGLGKTTLVDAGCAWMAAAGPLRLGRGQCLHHHGAGEAYLPVLEALGQLCRGPQGAALVAQLAQHAPTWLLQMPAFLSPADVEELHRRVLGATQERMLRELAEALDVLTAELLLVLVLEDLHWSDAATLDLLAYLAQRLGPARLLVLGTYRPAEAWARGHPLYTIKQELSLHGLCQDVALGWLTEAEVGQYLGARFAGCGVPAALVRLVAQRTDGNPLFLVTMVDYLVRQGWVAVVEGQVAVTVGLAALAVAVPESLRQLLELQFEQLEPEAQGLLETASVAGIEFAAALVAAGLEVPVGQVEEWCAALAQRGQFLRATGLEEWPDGTVAGRYGFIHGLYQQVLYDRLLVGRRTVLHRRLGERQEAAFGERAHEHAAALAVHFEGGREFGRAVHYRRQAADTALRRYAYREAVEHLTTALALLQTLPETPERARQELDLQMTLGPAVIVTQGPASLAVERVYTRAQALCRQLGETPALFSVLRGLWIYSVVGGKFHAAEALGQQLLALAQEAQDTGRLLEAHRTLAATLFYLGECTAAYMHAQQGLALYDPQQHHVLAFHYGQDPGVVCLIYAAWQLWYLGYPDQALVRSQEGLALAQRLSHPHSLALALNTAATLHQFRGAARATAECAEAALALATEHAFAFYQASSTILQGWALAVQGHGAEGIAQMCQGVAAYEATGAALRRTYFLALLAEAYGRVGQVAEGLRLLAQALTVVRATGEQVYEAELYRLQGALLLRQAAPDAAQAETAFQQALALARRQQARSWELRAALSLSRLWQQQGKRTEARELLAPVYGWFTEGFDTADLQEAKALLDELRRSISNSL